MWRFYVERKPNATWPDYIESFIFEAPRDTFVTLDESFDLRDQACYTIRAIDSCLNQTPSLSFCHIKTEGQALDQANRINWHPFQGYTIERYIVERLEQGNWFPIDTLPASDTTYTDAPLPCNAPQQYRVTGEESGGTRHTHSDTITLTPFDTTAPPAPDFYFTSVNSEGHIELEWNQEGTNVKYFELWRQAPGSMPQVIDTITYDNTKTDVIDSADQQPYSYTLIAIDSCAANNYSQPADTHQVMDIELSTSGCDTTIYLNWNAYRGFSDIEYRIQRKEEGGTFNTVHTLPAGQTEFIDSSVSEGSNYCYRIEAYDNATGHISHAFTRCITPEVYPEPPSPTLLKATVVDNGDDPSHADIYSAQVHPEDTTSIREYRLYHSNNPHGPFERIHQTDDLHDTLFTHTDANTDAERNYYYATFVNMCDQEGPSSMQHSPVLLEVENRNREAFLQWSGYDGKEVDEFIIYRSKAEKPFEPVDTTTDTTFSDTPLQCDVTYEYRIQGVLANGHTVWSNIRNIEAYDTVAPEQSEIIRATVTETGELDGAIDLEIVRSEHENLMAYLLYREVDTGSMTLHDTLFSTGTEPEVYSDNNINTINSTYNYQVVPLDSCANSGEASSAHRSIQLNATSHEESIQLNWNEYTGWSPDAHIIERNGTIIDTIAGTTKTYEDTELLCSEVYEYRVGAIHADGTMAMSNADTGMPTGNLSPEPPEIGAVSITTSDEEATLQWVSPPSHGASQFYIYREARGQTLPEPIDTLNSSQSQWIDRFSEPPSTPYCYTIRAANQCQNTSEQSQQACLILLEGNNDALTNHLEWNPYQEWTHGVEEYVLYKSIDDEPFNVFATIPGNTTSYTDEDLENDITDYCYQVQAIQADGPHTSYSTVTCIQQAAQVYIPNTFSPGQTPGINDTFGPEGMYIDNFELRIYSRWGQLIYETTDGEQWDGTYEGTYVSGGVYVYTMKVIGNDGEPETFEGTVTLIE